MSLVSWRYASSSAADEGMATCAAGGNGAPKIGLTPTRLRPAHQDFADGVVLGVVVLVAEAVCEAAEVVVRRALRLCVPARRPRSSSARGTAAAAPGRSSPAPATCGSRGRIGFLLSPVEHPEIDRKLTQSADTAEHCKISDGRTARQSFNCGWLVRLLGGVGRGRRKDIRSL